MENVAAEPAITAQNEADHFHSEIVLQDVGNWEEENSDEEYYESSINTDNESEGSADHMSVSR